MEQWRGYSAGEQTARLDTKQMACVVTLTGKDGFQHSVEVTAATLYEAAVRGLRELKLSDWVREETYDAAEVRVIARAPALFTR